MHRNGNIREVWIGAAALILASLPTLTGCERQFDGPFTPGNDGYVGDAWAEDRDGDGLSDSIAKYLPRCDRGPAKCLADARSLSLVWDRPRTLAAGDMILWLDAPDSKGAVPRIEISPAELTLRGLAFSSSDSAAVLPSQGILRGRSPGKAWITARLKDDTLAATFLVRVVAEGKRVQSLAARDMDLVVGADSLPALGWFPEDATYRDYVLSSADPTVVLVLDQRIRAVGEGVARVTARALDGGALASFRVRVGSPAPVPPGPRVESLSAENLIVLAGQGPRAPVLSWRPANAANRQYLLVSSDTGVVAVSPEKDRLIPRTAGVVTLTAISSDGGKTAPFTVTVVVPDSSVHLRAVSAESMVIERDATRPPLLTWVPADASDRSYRLVSSDHNVATIVDDTLVRAQGAGSASIQVLANGATTVYRVDVPANRFPQARITAPGSAELFFGGQALAFAGTASDPEDGELAAAVFTWEAWLVDTLPGGPPSPQSLLGPVTGIQSGAFSIPAFLQATPAARCRLVLTVKDSRGAVGRDSLELRPSLAALRLASNPAGLALRFDSLSVPSPSEHRAVVGFTHRIQAPLLQSLAGKRYAFTGWSDGKAAEHPITVPSGATTFTAAYRVLLDSVRGKDLSLEKGGPDAVAELTWWPEDAPDKGFSLRSLDSSVALIVADRVRGLKAGRAGVVVTARDGAKADTFLVTVSEPEPVPDVTITAKVRDFLEVNNTGVKPAHPDFNSFGGCPDQGYVKKAIEAGTSPNPPDFAGDNRNPAFAGRLFSRQGQRCFTSAARFQEWFTDHTGPAGTPQDINRPFLTDLLFIRNEDGTYSFHDDDFFPLDRQEPLRYRKVRASDPDPFGHINTGGNADLSRHNYGFTLEFHATMTYRAGKGQFITFIGDDDVWVFLNGSLIIDLGGIHAAQTATVRLDDIAAAIGLVDGQEFPLDFFFAERMVTDSHCHITLGMEIRP